MTHTEMPPHIPSQQEAVHHPNHTAIGEHIGGVALQQRTEADMPTDTYVAEGIGQLEAELAAAADAKAPRAEDAGRVHDVEEARQAAKYENEIFDVYEGAKLQNEVFNAHTEALKENEIFNAHAEALVENEARDKLAAEQLEQKAQEEKNAEDANKAAPTDYRKQAEQALQEAGSAEKIPAGSQVRKDPATGNLMVITNRDVKIIEPKPGGKSNVIDYRFNNDKKVLTIKKEGGSAVTVRAEDYIPSQAGALERPERAAITLPPAVAQVVGFKRAVPVAALAGKA